MLKDTKNKTNIRCELFETHEYTVADSRKCVKRANEMRQGGENTEKI